MLDRLTLDQLRVLIAIAETGTFSAAARRLGRVQSAISQSVQLLESTLGLALFDRGGKTPRLTEAGRVLLEDARHLVRGADLIRARAESLAADVEPELALAVDPCFPNLVLIECLARVSAVYPTLPVTVFSDSLGAAERRLRQGAAQLAIFVPTMAMATKGLATEFLTTIPFAPIVAATHPLAREPEPISRAALEAHIQLTMVDAGENLAPVAGSIMSPRTWGFSNLWTRIDHIVAGMGWGHVPLHMVDAHILSGKLKRLDIVGQRDRFLKATLHIAHEPGRPPGRAGRLLIDELRAAVGSADATKRRRGKLPHRPVILRKTG